MPEVKVSGIFVWVWYNESNAKNTSNVKTQSYGAKVYIKEVSPGKYNIIVEGDRGIITALKNISKKSLERLTKNYNWR